MKPLLSAAAALALSATTATADVSIPSGYWEAFRTANPESGKSICGMSTSYPRAGASIMVKYVEGDASMLVQIMKNSWRFPSDRQVDIPLTVGFDGYSQSVNAKGGLGENGQPLVEFRLRSGMDEFLRQFSDANVMWVDFPEGSEGRWDAKMMGSRRAAQLFRVCTISVLDQMAGKRKPTQPYDNKPTQPYGATKPASEPAKQKADDGSL
jgi:hypothetical protein